MWPGEYGSAGQDAGLLAAGDEHHNQEDRGLDDKGHTGGHADDRQTHGQQREGEGADDGAGDAGLHAAVERHAAEDQRDHHVHFKAGARRVGGGAGVAHLEQGRDDQADSQEDIGDHAVFDHVHAALAGGGLVGADGAGVLAVLGKVEEIRNNGRFDDEHQHHEPGRLEQVQVDALHDDVAGAELGINDGGNAGEDHHEHDRGDDRVHVQNLARRAVDNADDHRDHQAYQDREPKAPGSVADEHEQRGVKADLLADGHVHVAERVDEHGAHAHERGDDHVAHQVRQLRGGPDALALDAGADGEEDDAEQQSADGCDRGAVLFQPLGKRLLFFYVCHVAPP